MQLSEQAQAVLLLTSYFTKSDKDEPRPLSTHEWGKFAYWLKDRGLEPASLLSEDPKQLLTGWTDRGITQDRITYLLGRGGLLGFALEKWHRAGLWVLARSDAEYPDRLKKRLKLEAPPVLFGYGNRNLLSKGGIAVVGSRHASADELSFAAEFGAEAASEGISVLSGGARGIDESVMLGALECEGTVVGVLADSLLRSATSAKYRRHLMSNDVALISPFNPEAGFNVGNAMARNRYIYCLADAAVVAATSKATGGTWQGATENLKAHWVPLWVKSNSDPNSGNAALVRLGAKWLPRQRGNLLALFGTEDDDATTPSSQEALSLREAESHSEISNCAKEQRPSAEADSDSKDQAQSNIAPLLNSAPLDKVTFYELFLYHMASLTAEAALSGDDLQRYLDVTKSQLDAWLRRAIAEKRVQKMIKPVRYRWISNRPVQASLFDAS